MGFLSEEAKSAAAERVGAAVDEPTGAKPVEGTPVPEKPVQENPTPEKPSGGAAEVPANASETFTLTLEGDRTVEVDAAEAQRLMNLGMRAGDEDTIDAVRGLEKFVKGNPEGARALKALVDDPEAVSRFVEGLPEGAKEVEGEDPRDKRIRELEMENQKLQKAPEGQTAEQLVAEKASHYPALKELPSKLLVSAVKGRMADGESLSSALAGLASEQSASQESRGDDLRGKTTVTNRLRGVGGGGSAPAAAPEGASPDGRSLNNGGALVAARRRLAGG